MKRRNFLIVMSLLAIFLASAAAGRRMRQMQWMRASAADVFPDPATLPAACRAVTRVTSIEKVEADRFSESFLVKWTNSISCLNEARIELSVTRADGQTRTVTETASGATAKLIKVGLLPEGNRSKLVRAVVTAAGTQTLVAEKTISL